MVGWCAISLRDGAAARVARVLARILLLSVFRRFGRVSPDEKSGPVSDFLCVGRRPHLGVA